METRERTATDAAGDLHPAPGAVPVVDAPLEPLMLVREGWVRDRVAPFMIMLLVIGIAAGVVADALGWMETPGESARAMAGIAVLCAVVGVRLRWMLRWRHECVLDADGIAYWRSDAPAEESEWMRISWRDITEWSSTVQRAGAGFAVVSRDGSFIAVGDDPAPPGTVEFIRRFEAEVERHPRAEALPLDPDPRGTPFLSVSTLLYVGGMGAFALASVAVARARGVSTDPTLPGFALLVVLAGGLRLWTELDSSDIAYADRGARTWWRRTRNRLRRLLGIRHV